MTSNHVLGLLTLLAVGLLLAALGLSAAGLRLPAVTWPALGLPAISLPTGPDLSRDVPVTLQLIVGVIVGWTLRWVYSLPWGALPRAIVAWLLGWRRSVSMLSLAIGCTAVLLLY